MSLANKLFTKDDLDILLRLKDDLMSNNGQIKIREYAIAAYLQPCPSDDQRKLYNNDPWEASIAAILLHLSFKGYKIVKKDEKDTL